MTKTTGQRIVEGYREHFKGLEDNYTDETMDQDLSLRIDQALETANAEVERLKKQYEDRTPTEWAYEQVCKANEAKRVEVERLTKLHQKINKILMDVGRASSRDMLSTVVHLARKAAREALAKKETP